MRTSRRPTILLSVFAFASLLLLASVTLVPVAGAQSPDGDAGDGSARSVPVLVDLTVGEDEQIRQRLEWFYSTRRAGTKGDVDLAALRAAAVRETARMLDAQRIKRATGLLDADNFWAPMGPSPSRFGGWAFGPVTGRVPAMAADWGSGTLYVGSASGGVWKSTNDGLTWESIFDSSGTMTVGAVAVDPNAPETIWVGTGENTAGCESYFGIGLLRSADGGQTWETMNGTGGQTLDDLSSFADIVIDPRDSSHMVTGGRMRGCTSGSATAGGLYTSSDGGQTWTERISGTEIYEIQQDPLVPDTFWVASNKGIYKSIDNAVSFTLQTASGLPNGSTGRTELAVSPSDSNVVYALFSSASGQPEFWRTTDGGASWTEMSSGGDACDGQCWYNMVVRVHNTNPNIVFRGTIHVFRSTDGGANWVDLSNNWGSSQKVHQDTHTFLMDPDDPDTFWVGCDGGVWKTTDGGDSFLNRNGNMNLTQFYAIGVDAANGNVICGGAQDNSSLARTTENTWDLQTVTGDGFVCHIDPVDNSYAYITSYPSGGYPSIYRSETGVLGSFHVISKSGSGVQSGDRSNWVTPYTLDPTSPNILYLGTHRIYRSTNRGDHWDPVGPGDITGGSGTVLSLDVNRNYPNVVLAGTTDGRVWRSTNSGFDWENITTGLPSRSINDVASDPVSPDRILATVGGFNTEHLWEWTPEGGWVARGAGLPNVPANTVAMPTGTSVFVGTDTGVFRSEDGGVTFEPYMNGLPEGLVVTDLKYEQSLDLLTAGTYGRGAWQIAVEPIGPIMLFDDIERPLVEVDGDGDGNVEPGETWQVRPLLRNVGSQQAHGVTARLATATAGVTFEGSETRSYGNVDAGTSAGALEPYTFIVDPGFPCGEDIVFDVVDIRSSDDPGVYEDQPQAFTVTVVDEFQDPVISTWLDEAFDPNPTEGWTHEAIDPELFLCNLDYVDEWQFASKDAEHGDSYHCGQGPGGSYSRANYAWLYHGGRDSLGGPGIDIPADARTATLTLVHWYDTVALRDGGQAAIDANEDGSDVYEVLEPEGGYPDGVIESNRCNGLEGKPAFHGNSGGWITSTFDLTPYRGRKIYLAFIFGSSAGIGSDEGWYIDQVTVESETQGPPLCQESLWPASVPATAAFERVDGGDIRATWEPSCTASEVPGQAHAIEAGPLDGLAGGVYAHAPIDGICERTSPATFTPGAANEYYLVIPSLDGREGGGGHDSSGNPRPQGSTLCGAVQREAPCP